MEAFLTVTWWLGSKDSGSWDTNNLDCGYDMERPLLSMAEQQSIGVVRTYAAQRQHLNADEIAMCTAVYMRVTTRPTLATSGVSLGYVEVKIVAL